MPVEAAGLLTRRVELKFPCGVEEVTAAGRKVWAHPFAPSAITADMPRACWLVTEWQVQILDMFRSYAIVARGTTPLGLHYV